VRRIQFSDADYERSAERARVAVEAALAPWGGSETCIDAYEAGVRVFTDFQLQLARTLNVEPARSFAAGCADITRDLGATQVSSARWFLDV
jgi:hypothetical protein